MRNLTEHLLRKKTIVSRIWALSPSCLGQEGKTHRYLPHFPLVGAVTRKESTNLNLFQNTKHVWHLQPDSFEHYMYSGSVSVTANCIPLNYWLDMILSPCSWDIHHLDTGCHFGICKHLMYHQKTIININNLCKESNHCSPNFLNTHLGWNENSRLSQYCPYNDQKWRTWYNILGQTQVILLKWYVYIYISHYMSMICPIYACFGWSSK